MRTASPQLIAFLNSSTQFMMADLYRFTLLDGTVILSTDWDTDITVDGDTFSASGLKISRTATRVVVGLEVDTLTLTISPSTADRVGSVSFLAALNNGVLDGATFDLVRAFMSAPGVVVGTVALFSGSVSECEFGRFSATMKIKSELERLNMNLPRNLFQPGCRWTWGDTGCGLNREDWAAAGSILGGSTQSVLNVNGLTRPDGYYNQGVVLFDSGNLSGVKRTIRSHASGVLTLSLPLPKNPGYADAIKVYPGCDKTCASCRDRFNNLLRYGGFPFIPVPETAR